MAKQTREKTVEEADPELSTWDMAVACLTALRQTHAQALSERSEILAESGQNPYAAGVGVKTDIALAVQEAEQELEWTLSRVAKSNNLPLPK
ncbi:hypothetical protein [Tropicimonas sp. S265A]|uniref:hypothetical protein n=1 Tax=Tropicimonas sp. S265A TaxID=3415134 RepID=UPI003C7A7EBA